MVLAVEPMITAGRHMVRMGDDGWAIFSQDGSLAAHFEFTIASPPTAADPHAVARGRRRPLIITLRVRRANAGPERPLLS